MLRNLRFPLAACLLGVVLGGGCGGLPATVSGLVTLDGVPLTTGTVTFHPQEGGVMAYGVIDETGHYTVKSGAQTGLLAGQYTATVMANSPIETPAQPPRGQAMEPVGELLVPPRYTAKQLSPFHFQVQRGTNEFHLQLESAPAAN